MQKSVLRTLSMALGVVVSVAAPPVAAQTAGTEGARLDEIARAAAQQFVAARNDLEQTRPTVPLPEPSGIVSLTLDEATARALERNLELAVERLNPQTFDLNIARLEAIYRPTLTSQIGQRALVRPPTNQLNGGTIVQDDTTTYNAGIVQNLRWGGGDVSFQFNNNKQVTSNIFANFNPTYNSTFNAQLSQPLLRGFTIDTTRQQLRVTAINRDISEIQLRGTIATTLARVRNTYFELVYALDALAVGRGSLELAERLVSDNRARVEVGTMAPLDVVQAEAEVATRRQVVATAEAIWRTTELDLKRLIVSGTDDPLWRAEINPTDRPTFAPEVLDVESAVRRALDMRTDLGQARKTLAGNDITLSLLNNQRLPAVDVIANYGMQGLGGTQFIRQGSGLGSTVIGTVPGGYGNAFNTLFGRDYPTWTMQLNVAYPLFGSAADAQYARGRVQRNQAAAQLRALELTVATEVTNAALQVENGLKRYEAANAAAMLAQTRLEAEQSRFDVGLSTNFFVVQAQRDLATAQNSALRALLDYRQAFVDYQRAQEAPANRGAGITTVQAGGGGGGGN